MIGITTNRHSPNILKQVFTRFFVSIILISLANISFAEEKNIDELFQIYLDRAMDPIDRIKLFEEQFELENLKLDPIKMEACSLLLAGEYLELQSENIAEKYIGNSLNNPLSEITNENVFIYLLMADVEFKQKHYKRAKLIYGTVLESNVKIRGDKKDDPLHYQILDEIGFCFFELAQINRSIPLLDSSRKYFKFLYDWSKDRNDPNAKIWGNMNMGISTSNPDTSIYYFDRALSISHENDDDKGAGISYFNLFLRHSQKGNNELAETYLDSARKTYEKVDYLEGQSQLYLALAHFNFHRTKDVKQVYQSFLDYIDINNLTKEKLFIDRGNILGDLYEESKNKNAVLKLQAKLEVNEKDKFKLRSYVLGSALFILILIIFMVRIKKRSIKRRKINLEKLERAKIKEESLKGDITRKNRNLRDFGVDMSRKHEFTQHIIDRLKDLKSDDNPHQIINELLLDANNQLEIDDKFKALWDDAEDLNYQFMERLKTHLRTGTTTILCEIP